MSPIYTKEQCLEINKDKDYNRIGESFVCRDGTSVEVLCAHSCMEVDVLVTDGVKQFVATVQGGALKRGSVSSPFQRTVEGIGYVGIGKHLTNVSGKVTDSYDRWSNMITRCSPSYIKYHPTYEGTTVSEEFQCFQNFADWFEEERLKHNITEMAEFQVDKDFKGGLRKHYSRETCCIVHSSLNAAVTFQTIVTGKELPSGVSYIKNKNPSLDYYRGTYDSTNYRISKNFNISKLTDGEALRAAIEFYLDIKCNMLKQLAIKWEHGLNGVTVDAEVLNILFNAREYILMMDSRFSKHLKEGK